jgi:methylthioribose-1-phosphate isomerase
MPAGREGDLLTSLSVEPSLTWDDGVIVAVDQRVLPAEHRLLRLASVEEVVEAIASLAVRGAPAIGLAGALGVALSARRHPGDEAAVRADAARLAGARPTAVNLAWAVRRVLRRLPDGPDAVLAEAMTMLSQDIAVNAAMAARAADLVVELSPARPLRVLTHCNTGGLATAAIGTALGAIVELAGRGRIAEVLVDETRPLLQGARLTAWELGRAGVPYRLCVDSAAAAAMSRGLVDVVLVGADRIAANGDTANKIGTYGLAVAAARHGIPFVVVAPESTWDRELPDGSGIVVEERGETEVATLAGVRTAPADARVYNPAFDVTPAELITALVSESAIVRPGASPAERVAAMSRELYARGWMPGTSGNLSVRLPETRRAVITASGCDKGELTARQTVVVDIDTDAVAGDSTLRASAETAIHTAIYRHTDAGAVIHVHAPHATALATRWGADDRAREIRLRRFELLKGLGLGDPSAVDIPVFPNWTDVSDIAADVADHLARTQAAPPALLLTYHGVTVWGADLAEARNRLECLESICALALDSGAAHVQCRDVEPGASPVRPPVETIENDNEEQP